MIVLLSIAAGPALAEPGKDLRCGVDFALTWSLGKTPPGGLRMAEPPAAGKRQATIVLNPGPGLAGNADALAAWNRAVATWEERLEDPVTIVIDGDLQDLPTGVLGGSSARIFGNTFGSVRNAMIADAGTNETIVQGLPTSAQITILTPPGFTFTGDIAATKANFRALGFDMSFDNAHPDAEIVFNTDFLAQFDYDDSDGIGAGKFDFEAVVVHEIGHMLGFTSGVDLVDVARAQGGSGDAFLFTMDLLRLLPGWGGVDFTGADRILTTADIAQFHMTYDGTADLPMSTGLNYGDGNQASHWKADEISGTFIGIMDPTLSPGQHEEVTQSDLRTLGLLGWDIAPTMGVEDPPDREEDTGPPVYPYAFTEIYPNPFNPTVTVEYSLPASTHLVLKVVDLRGRLVRTLVREVRPAGEHIALWNGEDAAGKRVGSGVYFLKMESDFGTRAERVVLVK